MYCKNCGEEITNPNAEVCVACGTKVGKGNIFCKHCGAEINNSNAEVCLKCGCSLKEKKSNNRREEDKCSDKNKLTAGLIALFLGSLGIHRFYLGYKTSGIVMLILWILGFFTFGITMLITGVWAFIDAIRIFLGNMKDFEGRDLN